MVNKNIHVQMEQLLLKNGAAIAFLVFLMLLWLLFKPGSPRFYIGVEILSLLIFPLLLLPFCFGFVGNQWKQGYEHIKTNPSLRLLRFAPLFLGLAIISQSIGQGFFAYSYEVLHQSPFPSLKDAGYLSAYPFLLLAILFLSLRKIPLSTHLRIFLDSVMIMVGAATFSWYFILGPTILQGGQTWFAQVVAAAYPLGDLVLMACLLLLLTRSHGVILRPAVIIVALGLICNICADSAYDYVLAQGSYPLGLVTDVGWLAGYMLYGLGGQAIWLALSRASFSHAEQRDIASPGVEKVYSLLPYVLIAAVGWLFFSTYVLHYDQHSLWLYKGLLIGGALLILLLLVRQFFVIREITSNSQLLRQMQLELSEKNESLKTANMQLEEQTAQVEAACELQCRLNELKDQFLLNVNHELRTPLTEIQGYIELVQEYQGKLNPVTQARFLNNALHSCEELRLLISNVMDTMRSGNGIQQYRNEEVDVLQTVHEVLEHFDPCQLLDYTVEVDVPENLIAWGDPQYIRQVLRNLLSNAFKYTPPHTNITISAFYKEAAVEERNAPRLICVCVKDAGPGIPPEEIRLLFGKFIRLKRDLLGSVRGMGLGLYICKQLVEAMGGSIWVESTGISGEGSCFYFTLPQKPSPLPCLKQLEVPEPELTPVPKKNV